MDVDAAIFLPPDASDINYEARMQDVTDAVESHDGGEDEPVFSGGDLYQFHIETGLHPPSLSVIVGGIDGIHGLSTCISVALDEPQHLQRLHSQVEEAVDMVADAPDREGHLDGRNGRLDRRESTSVSPPPTTEGDVGRRVVPGDRIIREEATTVDSTGRVELGPEYANEDVRVIVVDDEPAAE